jgi:hypothetical protein
MTDTTQGAQAKRPQGRSPSYPAVNLQKSIERARVLYDKEKQYATPVESVVKHWGYSGLTGPAGLTLAALKKFGLISDEGSKTDRRVNITDLAVQILSHPSPEKQQEAIRVAALAPTAHAELWNEYGSKLPTDQTLTWTLTRDKHYTESGARDFLREYRETIDFAGLGDTPPIETSDADEASESDDGFVDKLEEQQRQDGRRQSTPPPPRDGWRTIDIPLPSGSAVAVGGQLPMSERDWVFFTTILAAMKDGFTQTEGTTAEG